MNRRQVLVAAGGGLLLATSQKAQTTVTFDDLSIDPGVMQGQQQALAALVQALQGNGIGAPVDQGLVDSAIGWSQVWTQVATDSGFSARIDQMYSNPFSPYQTPTPPDEYYVNLQNSLAGMGVSVQIGDLTMQGSAQDVTLDNLDFGGFSNVLNYFANGVLPLLYSPDLSSII